MVDLETIVKAMNDPDEGLRGWVDYVSTKDMAAMVAEWGAKRRAAASKKAGGK